MLLTNAPVEHNTGATSATWMFRSILQPLDWHVSLNRDDDMIEQCVRASMNVYV